MEQQGGAVKISFIDFDEPIYHWYAADVVRPFFDWYIEGYHKVCPQIDLSIERLKFFLLFKALDIYLWTLNNWQSNCSPKGEPIQKWMEPIKKVILMQSF
ncbi:MAG: hypothetical protein HQK52_15915 [Oligoflexia bacterium]|nr:hypothetical protein [Oligoflexia bacterium]